MTQKEETPVTILFNLAKVILHVTTRFIELDTAIPKNVDPQKQLQMTLDPYNG